MSEVSTFGNAIKSNSHNNDWIKRWEIGDTGFHMSQVHPYLLKLKDRFLKECSTVYVPLCGKTLDLIYLADEGHNVIGSECAEVGILQFFDDNKIKYERSLHPTAPFEVFKGIDKTITIYKGDFFQLDSVVMGRVDAIWDRGSFGAIHPSQQMKYGKIIHDIIKENGKYLLCTLRYEGVRTGNPYSVSENDVQVSFGQSFDISTLDSYESSDFDFVKQDGLKSAIATFNLLLPKS
ncbi:unnamed protein product [Clavelina lepadiformis]|uniref:thiopurine S-methyltransferase n=1 Tax=Clavelina lepadiformis TaxID=159417 RepID=A0ABP0F605_CLALP